MPVAKLLRSMSAKEFRQWQVYYHLEPFGEFREDLRIGAVAVAIINTLRQAHFKNPPLVKPEDFIMGLEKPKPKVQTWQEMRGLAKALAEVSQAQAVKKRVRAKP